MSDHDPALIEKAAKALADFTLCDPYPGEVCREDPCPQCAREASTLARAVLDAVADDLRDHCHLELLARAEQAEAERDHFAQVARDTFQELKTITAERDRAHATTSHEHALRLDAEAALSRVLADVEALAEEWEQHSLAFVSPKDRRTREDWQHVSGALRALVAKHREGK